MIDAINFTPEGDIAVPRFSIRRALTYRRSWLGSSSLEKREFEYAIFVTNKDLHVLPDAGTNGIICAIFGDGSVITTSNYWHNNGVVRLLRELEFNVPETLGSIGKALGRCLLCQKTLGTEYMREKGYGRVCEKKWGLDRFAHEIILEPCLPDYPPITEKIDLEMLKTRLEVALSDKRKHCSEEGTNKKRKFDL